MSARKRKKATRKKAPARSGTRKRAATRPSKKPAKRARRVASKKPARSAQDPEVAAEPQAPPCEAPREALPAPGERLDQHELAAALDALSALLLPYGERLEAEVHPELGYGLRLPATEDDAPFFGAVSVRDGHACLTLPPLARFPHLLQLVSPELTSFLHEGHDFRFERTEPLVLEELSTLIRACYEHLCPAPAPEAWAADL